MKNTKKDASNTGLPPHLTNRTKTELKVTQSASEKRLFTALDTLSGKVDCMEKRLDNVVTNTNKRIGDVYGELHNLQAKVLATTPAKPEDYVLTDADWQRVIKEQWLCEFWDAFEQPQTEVLLFIGQLEAKQANGMFLRKYSHHYNRCRPLNKPNVMQPYFGQGMPVKAGTKVLYKQLNGLHGIDKAMNADWRIQNNPGDIVAFMVLE